MFLESNWTEIAAGIGTAAVPYLILAIRSPKMDQLPAVPNVAIRILMLLIGLLVAQAIPFLLWWISNPLR